MLVYQRVSRKNNHPHPHLGRHAAEPGAVASQPRQPLHQQHLGPEARRRLGCGQAAGAGAHHLGQAFGRWGRGWEEHFIVINSN